MQCTGSVICKDPASEVMTFVDAPLPAITGFAHAQRRIQSLIATASRPRGRAFNKACLRPRDIHDAAWGMLSAVYGGAIHPTAAGHAAIADAVLPAAREVLALPAPAP